MQRRHTDADRTACTAGAAAAVHSMVMHLHLRCHQDTQHTCVWEHATPALGVVLPHKRHTRDTEQAEWRHNTTYTSKPVAALQNATYARLRHTGNNNSCCCCVHSQPRVSPLLGQQA